MSNKMTRVLDVLSVVLSIGMVGTAAVWLVQSGAFTTSLTDQQNATWYLIRALGITGYVLITISMAWGIVLSSRMVKDWSPGPLSMLLHSTVSWLGLIFGFGHAILLMADKFFAYSLGDILIPFTGPYRPIEVGLGTLAFWILLIVTPSFALRKRLFSHRAWRLLHYTSYAAFLMVTLHGLLAGTDGTHLGFRLLMGISVLVTVLLLAYRIRTRQGRSVPGRALRPKARRARLRVARSRAGSATAGLETAGPGIRRSPRGRTPPPRIATRAIRASRSASPLLRALARGSPPCPPPARSANAGGGLRSCGDGARGRPSNAARRTTDD